MERLTRSGRERTVSDDNRSQSGFFICRRLGRSHNHCAGTSRRLPVQALVALDPLDPRSPNHLFLPPSFNVRPSFGVRKVKTERGASHL